MPPRRRRQVYTPPPAAAPPVPGVAAPGSFSRAVTIDTAAKNGQAGLSVGDRVRITGAGLYAGESAVIERLSGSAIPAAFVRTESGHARQVRTIDLEVLKGE